MIHSNQCENFNIVTWSPTKPTQPQATNPVGIPTHDQKITKLTHGKVSKESKE